MGDNLSAMVRTAVTYVLLGCVVICSGHGYYRLTAFK